MYFLVTYDVNTESSAGRRRLRRVANVCVGHGQRVQKSVFECKLTDVQLEKMVRRLLAEVKLDEDSLRIYHLPPDKRRAVKVYGVRPPIDLDEPLVL